MQTLNSTSESEALLLARRFDFGTVLTKPMPKESSFHVLEKR